VKSIESLGIRMFRDGFHANIDLERTLVNNLIHQLKRERKGHKVSKDSMRGVFKMLFKLDLKDTIMRPLLLGTQKFYHWEGKKGVKKYNIVEYIKYVISELNAEYQRCLLYIGEDEAAHSIFLLKKFLVAQQVDWMIGVGTGTGEEEAPGPSESSVEHHGKWSPFEFLLNGSHIPTLKDVYNLCRDVKTLERVREAYQKYVQARGEEFVKVTDDTEKKTMLDNILGLRKSMAAILEDSFGDDRSFKDGLNAAFTSFVGNKSDDIVLEMCKILDKYLRQGPQGRPHADFIKDVDTVMSLLRFVKCKDTFLEHYKMKLANRLMHDVYADIEYEKHMVKNIRHEVGAVDVKKLESMFRDISLFKDFSEEFAQKMEEDEWDTSIKMKVKVLI